MRKERKQAALSSDVGHQDEQDQRGDLRPGLPDKEPKPSNDDRAPETPPPTNSGEEFEPGMGYEGDDEDTEQETQ